VVITAGVWLGKVKIFGVSPGIAFVLFAGIAAGYFGFSACYVPQDIYCAAPYHYFCLIPLNGYLYQP
jgi:hypothetical protein